MKFASMFERTIRDGRKVPSILLIAIIAPLLAGQQVTPPGPMVAQRQSTENSEAELRLGNSLTSQGHFKEALPHLLAARGQVAEEYAASFNLALCYVALHKPKDAVPILEELQREGNATPAVWNLLAQAYAGDQQDSKAFESLKRAAALTPKDEKLYAYVADACIDAHANQLGLKVVALGIENLPGSARLHYQRAVLLTGLDDFEKARADFDLVAQLAPGSEIAYISSAHEALIEGDLDEVIRIARQAIANRKDGYILLSMLGQALIRSGVDVGQPDFREAESALEKSIAENPDYSQSRISLSQMYLMEGRVDDCIAELDIARDLDPENPSVYSHLATALRRKGDDRRLRQVLEVLARLNQQQITEIREAGTKTGQHRSNVTSMRDQ